MNCAKLKPWLNSMHSAMPLCPLLKDEPIGLERLLELAAGLKCTLR